MDSPPNILIEGWRNIPHSYALVAQSLALELKAIQNLQIYFRDYPFANQLWKKTILLSGKKQEELNSLKDFHLDTKIHFRIAFPYDFSESKSEKLFVFATCEYDTAGDNITEKHLDEIKNSNCLVITPSKWSKQGLINSCIPQDKILIHPHGFSPEFRHRKDRKSHGKRQRNIEQNKDIVFLHIGAMTKNKGIDHILKAFNEILKSYPASCLILKGTDSLYKSKDMLYSLFVKCCFTEEEQEKILSRLEYIGDNLSEKEMLALYHRSDVYLSPYRAEGFNMPVLEAAASGLPVICTQGGPTDDFTPVSSTIKLPSNLVDMEIGKGLEIDWKDLVKAMSKIYENRDIRDLAWSNAKILTETHSWEKIAEQFLKITSRCSR